MTRPIVFVAGKDPIQEAAGGHSSYVRTHALAAVRAGYEPHLFCVSERREVIATEYGFVHKTWAPGVAWWHRRHRNAPIDMPFLAGAVEAFLRRQRASVPVHSFVHWGSAGVTALGRLALRHRHVVSMWDTVVDEAAAIQRGTRGIHGPRERLGRRLDLAWAWVALAPHERRALAGADAVLVNYDSVRRRIVARYPEMAGAIVAAPYTCESEMRREAPARAAATVGSVPHIVSLSRHDGRKGVDRLIEALALVRDAGTPFRATLCGPGQLLDQHRQLRDRLGLRGVVDLPGFVESPAEALAAADLFVLPSLEEGSGSMSLIEAMRAGLPVVTSEVDGLPEDIRDGVDGLVAPPTPATLAAAVERVLGDPALRRRLGAAARARFDERFGADAFVRAMGGAWEG